MGDCSRLRREPSLTLASAVPLRSRADTGHEGWKIYVIGHILEHMSTMTDLARIIHHPNIK